MLHLPVSHGHISDEEYRAILAEFYGVKSSCDLDEGQRGELIASFRSLGWLDGRGAGGSQRAGQPTPRQWAKLAALSRKLWTEGLTSHGLQTWVRSKWGARLAEVSDWRADCEGNLRSGAMAFPLVGRGRSGRIPRGSGSGSHRFSP